MEPHVSRWIGTEPFQRFKEMKELFFFRGLGAFFLSWFTASTIHSVLLYGWDKGSYLWIDNLVLFGLAVSLILRKRSVAIVTLSFGLTNQLLLLIDNVNRMAIGKNPLGLSEFLYQPGMGMLEFLFHHSHWFTLPILVATALLLKPEKKSTWISAIATHAVVLLVSRFFFSFEANVNCMHHACYAPMESWQGKAYAVVFLIGNLVLTGLLAVMLDRSIRLKGRVTKKRTELIYHRVALCSLVAVMFIAMDVIYKISLPSFVCEGASETDDVKVSCGYTTDYTDNWMYMSYSLQNKKPSSRECSSYIEVDGKRDLLQESLVIRGKRKSEIAVLIPYPKKTMRVHLSADCRPL
jgi:nitrate reductase gamma subunit